MPMTTLVDVLRPLGFRGKARLFDRLAPRTGSVETTVFGYSVALDLSDHIQRLIYIGAYERELHRIVRSWLKPGMTFLDVGANIGFFTLLAARCVGPTGRVIAVEPSPWVGDRLEETVRRNRLANVTVARLALGSTSGTLSLISPVPGNHTPSLLDESPGLGRNLVTVARLDDCLAEWLPSNGVVHAMKVDIEGFEPYLVDGGADALRSGRIRRLATEASSEWLAKAGSSPERLRSQLEQLGFTCVGTLDPGSENQTFLMEHA